MHEYPLFVLLIESTSYFGDPAIVYLACQQDLVFAFYCRVAFMSAQLRSVLVSCASVRFLEKLDVDKRNTMLPSGKGYYLGLKYNFLAHSYLNS